MDPDSHRGTGRNPLGLIACIALVAGNMIGSGIFLLPASLAPYGGIALLGWAFTTFGAVCLALLFARLAALRPLAGGPYAYSRAGFGDFIGFWISWGYWNSIWAGNAAIAVAMISYLRVFIPAIGASLPLAAGLAVAVVWLLTIVNCRGLREAGVVQVLTTVLKLAPLLVLPAIGWYWLQPSHFVPFNRSPESGFSAVSATAALTLWSFLGLESATIPADSVRDPRRTIPRATLLGTLIAAVVYIAGTVVVMGILPPEALANSGAPFADAGRVVGGDWAYYAVGMGAVLSSFGALNGWILLQGQLPRAAALDGMFPAPFATLSRRGTPIFGLVLSSLLTTVLLGLNYSGAGSLVALFNFAILLSTLAVLIPYAFCAMSALLMERGEGAGGRIPAKALLVAGAAFLYSLWAIYGAGAPTVLYGFLLQVAGLPVYVWLRRRPSAPDSGSPAPSASAGPASG